MTDCATAGLTPETEARREIDAQLVACGWVIHDHQSAAVAAARGVAVREVPVGKGWADYVLFVDCQAVGVVEAKPVGTTLTGVEPQTLGYRKSYPGELPMFEVGGVLPFGYESTGVETRFTCGLDPVPTSRRVFSFHRPETLARWVEDQIETGVGALRAGLQLLPDLEPGGLWTPQAEAVRGLEASLRDNRPKALIQMTMGAGKTFTAVTAIYRLVR
ncbi:MAG: DEAD/DEAH box helicase family protein, partial [bacterium]|nr:DEAD/DEAH box helicase family protein [bacterium]